ncbi:hypothetical protein J3R82DRAFT_10976 [Butyriboletus roseoflavus]|nr:hypothetical protein J3R82DRAFT_10976 [Butyriboletus roseoflavus]
MAWTNANPVRRQVRSRHQAAEALYPFAPRPPSRRAIINDMPFDGIAALFYRTPREHLNGMWKIIKKLPPSPPPRHVRVHVYLGWKPGCDETEFVMRHSALVADFPLDRSGRLALARVKSKWALQGCVPIDPCRRVKFDTIHPGYISPLAIRVLTESEGVLKLFGTSLPRASFTIPHHPFPSSVPRLPFAHLHTL